MAVSMDTSLPEPAELDLRAQQLKDRSKALQGLSRAVVDGAPAGIAAATARLVACAPEQGASQLHDQLGQWIEAESSSRRLRLATALRRACDAQGLEARVVQKQPLELRVAPFSVVVDVDADTAWLCFGREKLRRCRALATEIMACHQALQDDLNPPERAPEHFHGLLREAWRRVCGPRPAWVPLHEVWVEVALLTQPAGFRASPSQRKFVDYARGAFIFDMWKIRRDRALEQGGWRLEVGTAAGDSMRDRKAVFWLEDDRGVGQWHHTLHFSRAGAP